jgi:tRNA threonylcarbamoyladenosine biosynthesis protein TsaB
MLLLAVDTSGKNGSMSLALIAPNRSEVDVLETVPLAGGAFSAQLVPQIAELLQKHGSAKNDLGAFAVASGPGSFTGLRVGLAAIKALAEALHRPIAAVSLLEAVACSGKSSGRVLAALDAGRCDIYVGDYELDQQVPAHAHLHSERLRSREEFLGESAGRTVITPDAALAEIVRAAKIAPATRVEEIEYPNSAVIARLGWHHLQQGQTINPADLEANYIRHSDAEIFSKPKL